MAGWLLQRAAELRRDFTWREAGGSLGDLGTFVPLLVGLTVQCGLDVGTTLVFTGLYNLATALVFDVPMPLQPMLPITLTWQRTMALRSTPRPVTPPSTALRALLPRTL